MREERYSLSFILSGNENLRAIGKPQGRGMERLSWKPHQPEFLQNPLHFHTLHAERGYVPSAYDLPKHQKSCLNSRKPEGKQLDPALLIPLYITLTHPPVHWQCITRLRGFGELPSVRTTATGLNRPGLFREQASTPTGLDNINTWWLWCWRLFQQHRQGHRGHEQV